jgi:hypothetical protein
MNTNSVYRSTSITDACFEIQRLNNNTYTLSVTFFDNVRKISEIAFKAISIERIKNQQSNAFNHYAYLIETSSFLYSCDMQPINGIKKDKRFLKNLIRQSSIKDFNDQVSYVESHYNNISERINLFVLDVKDKNNFYEDTQEIEKAEDEVALFLQAPKPLDQTPRREFHQIIQNQQIRFFLREGKLKSDLIHSISTEQADFFQINSQGRERFCQLCEVLMNFFKKGFTIESTLLTLHPSDYFSSTYALGSTPLPEFALTKIHSLSLLTLYPSYYKDLYSQQEEYFKSINNTFQVGYIYDTKTKTTAITIS